MNTVFLSCPKIFIKEASLVRKPLLCEEPFTPRQKSYSPILAGIPEAAMPMLKGYVCSTPKALADVPMVSDKDDPVLAHWQYGVGKSVAFTSDAQARWAAEWLGWDRFAKFWTQLVRWTLRGQLSQDFQMHTEIDEGTGHVVVDAVDVQGNFINFLEFQGSVISPDLERRPLTLRQTGPGRYEATFEVGESGGYLVSARTSGSEGAGGLITGGLALSYSPEYKNVRSNEALLRQVKDITGGRLVSLGGPPVDLFDHDLPSGSKPEPLWPRALALAILLVPVDVFFRRVMIDWRDVARAWAVAYGWAQTQARQLLVRRPREREEALEALLQVKEKVRESQSWPKGRRPASPPRPPSETFLEALERAKQRADGDVLEQSDIATAEPKPVVVRKSEKEELRKPRVPAETGQSRAATPALDRLLKAKKRARTKKP